MPDFDITELVLSFHRRLQAVPKTFTRFLAGKIDWEDRLIGIRGARGCGKTTLLLQHLHQSFPQRSQCLYASLDHLWFTNHSLNELVEYFVSHGGTHLYLDEIHYLPQWQTVLKNLYDDFPNLHIVYTGSSLLKMDQGGGDLSRRQIIYDLPGLSFREFLELDTGLKTPVLELDDLLARHSEIAMEICGNTTILPLFEKYLRFGYYPFYREVKRGFDLRLQETVNRVLESDYPILEPITISTLQKTKRMLQVLAESVPQTPNLGELCEQLETDRNQALKMLDALARAGLLGILYSPTKTLKHLGWPQKILLHNTNLMAALGSKVTTGTMRETFFLNQVQVNHQVHAPKNGDFLVDGRHLFEVGGRKKSYRQIQDIPDSYLAVDNLEVGYGNRIPLWLFGLLY